jgi:TetR/AcrR family transcriptional regulator, lmrAB and yxaGH operons repressor
VPAAILSRDEVIDRLMLVLRRRGFAGASLSELSKATGLGKSSLYHYFPDGKDDMTRAVLGRLAGQLRKTLFEPLRSAGAPRRRLDAMVATLDAFYRGGREACLLGNLVVGETRERFHDELASIFEEWIEAIATVLRDAGLSRPLARVRSADAVIRIEGALVLTGAFGSVAAFERTLRELPRDLLAPAGLRRA